MAKTDTLHIRVEPSVKQRAEKTLNELGLSITEAVNVFLNQVILNDGIPFEIKKPHINRRTSKGYTNLDEMWKDLEKEE